MNSVESLDNVVMNFKNFIIAIGNTTEDCKNYYNYMTDCKEGFLDIPVVFVFVRQNVVNSVDVRRRVI